MVVGMRNDSAETKKQSIKPSDITQHGESVWHRLIEVSRFGDVPYAVYGPIAGLYNSLAGSNVGDDSRIFDFVLYTKCPWSPTAIGFVGYNPLIIISPFNRP